MNIKLKGCILSFVKGQYDAKDSADGKRLQQGTSVGQAYLYTDSAKVLYQFDVSQYAGQSINITFAQMTNTCSYTVTDNVNISDFPTSNDEDWSSQHILAGAKKGSVTQEEYLTLSITLPSGAKYLYLHGRTNGVLTPYWRPTTATTTTTSES